MARVDRRHPLDGDDSSARHAAGVVGIVAQLVLHPTVGEVPVTCFPATRQGAQKRVLDGILGAILGDVRDRTNLRRLGRRPRGENADDHREHNNRDNTTDNP